ncbi:peptide deformylase [candidate division KSB1 bacterium]
MSILAVLTYPNSVLRKKSKPVAKVNAKVEKLINDMIETMSSFHGCVGISAPQIGRLQRIIVVDISKHKKAPHNNRGLIVILNPVLIHREGRIMSREGCLSLPEYTGNVQRVEKIKVKGKDRHGKRIEFFATGFESIAIQHEIDHLNGVLFIDRISSLKADLFMRKRISGERK